jgi:hypothetical protein
MWSFACLDAGFIAASSLRLSMLYKLFFTGLTFPVFFQVFHCFDCRFVLSNDCSFLLHHELWLSRSMSAWLIRSFHSLSFAVYFCYFFLSTYPLLSAVNPCHFWCWLGSGSVIICTEAQNHTNPTDPNPDNNSMFTNYSSNGQNIEL